MIDEGGSADDIKRVERAKLNALLAICETPTCRRQAILAHFGEAHGGNCGNCDTCIKPVETWDGTDAAIKALAAIYRTGERFGTGHLIDVLTGNINEKTTRYGHADMPVFGAGKDIPSKAWQSVYRQLLAAGFVSVDHEAFGALKLQPEARAVFKREREVRFRKDRPTTGKASRNTKSAGSTAVRTDMSERDHGLFQKLRALRASIAKDMNVPPYVIFPDTTLMALAKERPTSGDDLLGIPGIGATKRERYGDVFLEAISNDG
jgi:ATP-dependent DNA helicase RecQ